MVVLKNLQLMCKLYCKTRYDIDLISIKKNQNLKILNKKINFISLNSSRLILLYRLC